MILDLINFIKKILGGVKKTPPNEYINKKDNKQTPIKKYNKPKKEKRKKRLYTTTFISAFTTVVILIYWISLSLDFAISNELILKATIESYNEKPFGINLTYDIQKGNTNYLGMHEIGDVIKLTQDGFICNKNEDCLNMIVDKTEGKNIYMSFEDNAIPTFLLMTEFKEKLFDSGKSIYGNHLLIHGKLINNKFIINKIVISN